MDVVLQLVGKNVHELCLNHLGEFGVVNRARERVLNIVVETKLQLLDRVEREAKPSL